VDEEEEEDDEAEEEEERGEEEKEERDRSGSIGGGVARRISVSRNEEAYRKRGVRAYVRAYVRACARARAHDRVGERALRPDAAFAARMIKSHAAARVGEGEEGFARVAVCPRSLEFEARARWRSGERASR